MRKLNIKLINLIIQNNYTINAIMDKDIENLIVQLSRLKLSEDKNDDKDVDDLIKKLSTLKISDDEEIDDLIKQMSKMKLADEIKLIILHTINHCRLQHNKFNTFIPHWGETF